MSLPDRKKNFGSNIPGEEPIQKKPKGSSKKFGSTLPNDAKGRRSKVIRNRSMAQENRLAKKMGGHRVPGSGSLTGGAFENARKGDVDVHAEGLTARDGVVSRGFKFEAKSTKKSSFSISKKLIEKTFDEAYSDGMEMALAIELLGLKDSHIPDKYVVVAEDTFAQLLELALLSVNENKDDE